MIATTVGYDLWFVAHLIVALVSLAVVASMRFAGLSVTTKSDLQSLLRKFPDRPNWAARVVHLAPITGLILSATGGHDVALSRPWIGAGVTLYLILAVWLEARVLPLEKLVAVAIRDREQNPVALARKFVHSVDSALVLLIALYATMIIQF